ncbi:MAG: SMC-Scp complex subunit ScpB [Acidobacteria bacterium]|nr:SMC-Scp complex subunit ScpB [Acidobacteriota bacterium]
MVVDHPTSTMELASTLALPVDRVNRILTELRDEYDGYTGSGPNGASKLGEPRGFELRNVAGGWRIYSRADFADYVSAFVLDGQSARLTSAALETLAVIAYRQPVSRARVSAIRGVSVDSVVRTLTTRGLIEEVGTDPVSGSLLYGTTAYFLERLGVDSVGELPQLAPHLPGLENLHDFDDSTY